MFTFMIVLFVIGYACIALEHPLKINKSASALLLAALLWVCAVIGGESLLLNDAALRDYLMINPGSGFSDWLIHHKLIEILGDVSQIIFFLMGAMTIVEIIDNQGGFSIITEKIATTHKVKLLWIISLLSFFMSAVLDNMTSAIVMVALLRKLIGNKQDRWFYASMVIVAANSGGAWSPIGDVTTIMLWIAGKVTTLNIIEMTFIASLVSLIVPLVVLSFIMKGNVERPHSAHASEEYSAPRWQQILFLVLGVACLIFVPIFKTITHLPPYIGMLAGVGVMWVTSEIVHRKSEKEVQHRHSITNVLSRIDVPSLLFFLGILLAVNALATVGHLELLSQKLDSIPLSEPSKYYVINMIIGVLSSVVDNVPLVAGAMNMYSFPTDHYFWEFLAYCAGTGGSILIIGSAAGVAVMGMEKIDFIWYLKKISWIALIGYFAGCGVFILEKNIRGAHNTEEVATQNIEMTEDAVKQYLLDNTFYVSENTENYSQNSYINFIQYTDAKTQQDYIGLKTLDNWYTQPVDTLLQYGFNSQVMLNEVEIEIMDTVAQVLWGELPLIVTQSGQVGIFNEQTYTLIPLNIKK